MQTKFLQSNIPSERITFLGHGLRGWESELSTTEVRGNVLWGNGGLVFWNRSVGSFNTEGPETGSVMRLFCAFWAWASSSRSLQTAPSLVSTDKKDKNGATWPLRQPTDFWSWSSSSALKPRVALISALCFLKVCEYYHYIHLGRILCITTSLLYLAQTGVNISQEEPRCLCKIGRFRFKQIEYSSIEFNFITPMS